MREAKAIYSGPATAKESASITCIWQRCKGRVREGELYGSQRDGSMCALLGGCWQREVGSKLMRSKASCVIG